MKKTMLSAIQHNILKEIAEQVANATHGGCSAIYTQGAECLGITVQTLHRWLKEQGLTKPRKKRANAGQTALTLVEARLISAVLLDSIRRNDKQQSSLKLALERLRSNGLIVAGTSSQTGEIKYLSETAVARALRQYGVHPEQLLQDAPCVRMASKHPNHVWQIDASLSTQFYLDVELEAMPTQEFYKNKPENFKRIEKQRLWRYAITDHTSGAAYVEYVLGAESSQNLCHVLINAMQRRTAQDVMYGVPLMLVTDPGSAMTAAATRNFCRALDIELIINEVGNARAKGQVEQFHNIIENEFESGLKLREKIRSLSEINQLAQQWLRVFNATRIHSRTGKTRAATWMTISQTQLRLAPSVELCRQASIANAVECKVYNNLCIRWRGGEYKVADIPNIRVGEKVQVTRNLFDDDNTARLLYQDDEGRERYYIIPKVQFNQYGFDADAVMFGEGYKRHADTPAQTERKNLERLTMQAMSDEQAKENRKTKTVPFGGQIDPYKSVSDTVLPDFMPKRGTDLVIDSAPVESLRLNLIQSAKRLADLVGDWCDADYLWLAEHYPQGVPSMDLDKVAAELRPVISPLKRIGAW